ncbi:hypothetical protein FBQ97_17640, partial [Acidobacteria bacterium ACD]|nr:hypothetical protein [Acidobacteria bacterium ACD]
MTRHLLRLVWNRRRSHLLVGVEILVSFLIVFVVAVLAVTTFGNARQPVGFSAEDVTVVESGLKKGSGADPLGDDGAGGDRERMRRALEAVRRLDGVESAAGVFLAPYGSGSARNSQEVDGRRVEYGFTEATDESLEVLKLRVVAGRWFSREDDGRPYRAAVVTRELAREVFGGEDPVGKDLPDGGGPPEGETRRPTRVVGVLAAYRERNVYSAAEPFAIFRSDLSNPEDSVPSRIVVRLRPGTPRAF